MTKNKNKPLVEVFTLFAKWYNEEMMKGQGYPNLRDYGKVFIHLFEPFTSKRFGTHTWAVAINGQEKELDDPIGKSTLQPYHMHVYRNGWFVATCSPHSGQGVYDLDNQFIELLEHLLKKKRKKELEAE